MIPLHFVLLILGVVVLFGVAYISINIMKLNELNDRIKTNNATLTKALAKLTDAINNPDVPADVVTGLEASETLAGQLNAIVPDAPQP